MTNVLGSLANFGSFIKQAQQLGSRLEGLSQQLREQRATGTAAGGLVEIEVNGLSEVVRCRIDPALLAKPDAEMLEELIRGATNQALAKSRQLHADAMRSLAGGVELPGLDEAISKLSGGELKPS